MGELRPRDGDADPTPNGRQQDRLRRSADQPENGSRERPGPSGCDRWLIGRASWSRTSPAARPWPRWRSPTPDGCGHQLSEALTTGVRTRGTAYGTKDRQSRSCRRDRRPPCDRFIPACAGNTDIVMLPAQATSGSSPRARGTPAYEREFLPPCRFIPACAGNTRTPGTVFE
jgi:hypothetical protein